MNLFLYKVLIEISVGIFQNIERRYYKFKVKTFLFLQANCKISFLLPFTLVRASFRLGAVNAASKY